MRSWPQNCLLEKLLLFNNVPKFNVATKIAISAKLDLRGTTYGADQFKKPTEMINRGSSQNNLIMHTSFISVENTKQ